MKDENIADLEQFSTELNDIPVLDQPMEEVDVLDSIENKLVENDNDELLEPEEIGGALYALAEDFAPNWQLSEKVCNRLGRPYAKVLNKLLAKTNFKYKDEAIAIVLTLFVIVPRLGVPMKGEPIDVEQVDQVHG